MSTENTTDIGTLRRAIEQSDAALLMSLYAEDAELRVIDRSHPPSAPLNLHGKAAISAFFNDICSRAMTHKVTQEEVGDDRWAFTEACKYPDGAQVFCAAIVDLRDGKIIRQVNVQAWDE